MRPANWLFKLATLLLLNSITERSTRAEKIIVSNDTERGGTSSQIGLWTARSLGSAGSILKDFNTPSHHCSWLVNLNKSYFLKKPLKLSCPGVCLLQSKHLGVFKFWLHVGCYLLDHLHTAPIYQHRMSILVDG